MMMMNRTNVSIGAVLGGIGAVLLTYMVYLFDCNRRVECAGSAMGFMAIHAYTTLPFVLIFLLLGMGFLISGSRPQKIPPGPLSLNRLDINWEEYSKLKTIGITNLKDLAEERGHEEEISSLTLISTAQL